MSPSLPIPLRYGSVTAHCLSCGQEVRAEHGRRRTYCSDACRQFAYRRRNQGEPSAAATLPTPRLSTTVYECESCEVRFVGIQRCPDCGHFARRLGAGGQCPNCDELVAISDLANDQTEVSIK